MGCWNAVTVALIFTLKKKNQVMRSFAKINNKKLFYNRAKYLDEVQNMLRRISSIKSTNVTRRDCRFAQSTPHLLCEIPKLEPHRDPPSDEIIYRLFSYRDAFISTFYVRFIAQKRAPADVLDAHVCRILMQLFFFSFLTKSKIHTYLHARDNDYIRPTDEHCKYYVELA